MKKMITLVFVVFIISSCFAGDDIGQNGGSFLKIKVNARALGMGGAYLTQSEDASAVIWNPAGLGFANGVQFHNTIIFNQGPDQAISNSGFNNGFFAVTIPLPKENISIGVGLRNHSFDDLEYMGADKISQGSFGYQQMAIMIAGGYQIVEDFSLGMSLAYTREGFTGSLTELSGAQGSGLGYSFSMLYKINKKMTMGLKIESSYHLHWDYSDQYANEDKVPYKGKTGFAYKPSEWLTVAIDAEGTKNWPLAFNYGCEANLTKFIDVLETNAIGVFLRAGMDNGITENFDRTTVKLDANFNLGLGFEKNISARYRIGMDWAYCFHELHDRMVWSFNITGVSKQSRY